MASPIIFHVAKLSHSLYLPLLLVLDGPFLTRDEGIMAKHEIKIGKTKRTITQVIHLRTANLLNPKFVLTEFLSKLSQMAMEVSL